MRFEKNATFFLEVGLKMFASDLSFDVATLKVKNQKFPRRSVTAIYGPKQGRIMNINIFWGDDVLNYIIIFF
jgi:hypothetical protein